MKRWVLLLVAVMGAVVLGGCSAAGKPLASGVIGIYADAGGTIETEGNLKLNVPYLWSASSVCLRSGKPQRITKMVLRHADGMKLVDWGIRPRSVLEPWDGIPHSYADQGELPNIPKLVTSVPGFSRSTRISDLCSANEKEDTWDQTGITIEATKPISTFSGIWAYAGDQRVLLEFGVGICTNHGPCPEGTAEED